MLKKAEIENLLSKCENSLIKTNILIKQLHLANISSPFNLVNLTERHHEILKLYEKKCENQTQFLKRKMIKIDKNLNKYQEEVSSKLILKDKISQEKMKILNLKVENKNIYLERRNRMRQMEQIQRLMKQGQNQRKLNNKQQEQYNKILEHNYEIENGKRLLDKREVEILLNLEQMLENEQSYLQFLELSKTYKLLIQQKDQVYDTNKRERQFFEATLIKKIAEINTISENLQEIEDFTNKLIDNNLEQQCIIQSISKNQQIYQKISEEDEPDQKQQLPLLSKHYQEKISKIQPHSILVHKQHHHKEDPNKSIHKKYSLPATQLKPELFNHLSTEKNQIVKEKKNKEFFSPKIKNYHNYPEKDNHEVVSLKDPQQRLKHHLSNKLKQFSFRLKDLEKRQIERLLHQKQIQEQKKMKLQQILEEEKIKKVIKSNEEELKRLFERSKRTIHPEFNYFNEAKPYQNTSDLIVNYNKGQRSEDTLKRLEGKKRVRTRQTEAKRLIKTQEDEISKSIIKQLIEDKEEANHKNKNKFKIPLETHPLFDTERNKILQLYMKLIHEESEKKKKNVNVMKMPLGSKIGVMKLKRTGVKKKFGTQKGDILEMEEYDESSFEQEPQQQEKSFENEFFK